MSKKNVKSRIKDLEALEGAVVPHLMQSGVGYDDIEIVRPLIYDKNQPWCEVVVKEKAA